MVPTESVDLEGVPAAEFGTVDQLGHRRDVNAPVCGLYPADQSSSAVPTSSSSPPNGRADNAKGDQRSSAACH